MVSNPINGTRQRDAEPLWDFVVVVTLLCSLGFPGSLEDSFGRGISFVILYGPFALQIAVMLLSSGDSMLEMKLIDLKFKYMPIYLLTLIWFILSISVTNYMTQQIIACVRFSVTALFAIWIIEKYDIDKLLTLIYYAVAAMVFFTTLYLIFFPGSSFSFEAGEKTFCGLYHTKNSCATELSFGIVYQVLMFKRFFKAGKPLPRYFVPVLLLQMVFMMMSKSTGSLFYTGFTIFCLFFFSKKDGDSVRLPLGLIHVIVSVGFLILSLSILPVFEPLFDMIGKDVTLTGRTPMWARMIEVITTHNSFQGFGFTMFWKDRNAYKLFHEGFQRRSWGNTMTYGAHNTILEIWLDTGLIGLSSYFIMILVSMRNVGRMENGEYEFCEVFMIWQTLMGLLERSYIPFNYHTLFLFMSVALACKASLPRHKKRHVPARYFNEAIPAVQTVSEPDPDVTFDSVNEGG